MDCFESEDLVFVLYYSVGKWYRGPSMIRLLFSTRKFVVQCDSEQKRLSGTYFGVLQGFVSSRASLGNVLYIFAHLGACDC